MGSTINSKHYEAQPTLSADGRVLLFISDRPDGIGGLDIYNSMKDNEGNWSAPKNLGAIVNTAANEGSPLPSCKWSNLIFCQ